MPRHCPIFFAMVDHLPWPPVSAVACDSDVLSIATDESQWCLVDEDTADDCNEEDLIILDEKGSQVQASAPKNEAQDADAHLNVGSPCDEVFASTMEDAVDALDERPNYGEDQTPYWSFQEIANDIAPSLGRQVEPSLGREVNRKTTRFPCARLLGVDQKELEYGLWECDGYQGHASGMWMEALKEFPQVDGAYCLGRLAKEPGVSFKSLGALVRLVVCNSGKEAWPHGTALRLVAGHGFGFDALEVGALGPDEAAEMLLDLTLPMGHVGRSGWVFEDGYGCPFGPLLVLELVSV